MLGGFASVAKTTSRVKEHLTVKREVGEYREGIPKLGAQGRFNSGRIEKPLLDVLRYCKELQERRERG